jgi:DNA repair ATPase RecN
LEAPNDLEMTEVYYTLISNMIRVYKENVKEVKSAHGRIKNSLNQFNNTNTQIQSGGKKIHLNEMNVMNEMNKINKKQQIKKQKSKTYSKTKKYKKRM